METSVLIAGAGPTGLAAALALSGHQIPVTIIDPVVTRSPFSKALAFNPRSQELLEASGVTAAIRREAREVTGLRMHDAKKVFLAIDFDCVDHDPNTMLVLPQARTEALMEQALAERGISVQRGMTLVDAEQQGDAVMSTLRDADGNESYLASTYLIGADGAHSKVREITGQDFPGDALAHDWTLADVRIDAEAWQADTFNKAHLVREKNRFVFVLPVSPGILRVVSDDEGVLDDLPALVRDATPQEVVWQSSFRVSHRQVANYQHGNLFLAGDAAHIHSPVGGRGMNMGIEDAFCLADCIGQETPEDYHRLRHAYGKQAIRLIKAQTLFATNHSLLTNLVTRLFGPMLFSAAKARREFARRNLGLQN
jgi:2-polyprenyl-6-methoxyphenol hydroxylase-like FAD-dependent oxidoreductase